MTYVSIIIKLNKRTPEPITNGIQQGFGHYKRGLCDALANVGLVYELDYINNHDYDLEAIVKTFQPHLLLAQCHNSYDLPLRKLADARAAKPDMIAVNWNGDVWE